MRSLPRPAALSLLALAPLSGFWGCQARASAAAGAGEAEPRIVRKGSAEFLALGDSALPGLKWSALRLVEVPGSLEASGLVNYDPRKVASIVSRVQGRIEDVRVSLWDRVEKGDRIVQLYSPDFMTAEAEYLQAASPASSSGPAGESMEGMSAALATAAKQKLTLLGMSPQDLAELKAPEPVIWMRAPIGGTVLDDKVVRGSAVNPGDVLYTLGVLDEVLITADIYEEDAPRLEAGQKLDARVVAFPGEVFHGVISNVSPDLNPDTHTLQIRSKVANPGRRLKPRMLASVTIYTRPGAELSVPQESLVFDTDGYYAFVKTADGISRRRVEIASSGEGPLIRVRSGLKAGERVAVSETIQLNALWHRARGEGS